MIDRAPRPQSNSDARPRILTFVGQYLPGFKAGGVLRTVVNMVDGLSQDFEFRVVTRDRDLKDPAPYSDVRPGEWQSVGGSPVYYLSPREQTVRHLARLVSSTPHDVIHMNSAFDPVVTIRVLLARRFGMLPPAPVVIAPRGEFGAGSFRIKIAKKRAYLSVAALMGLYRDVVWHASSAAEAEDIRSVMGPVTVHVAPDMPQIAPPSAVSTGARAGRLRVAYLGRISREKNLDYALRVLKEVQVPLEFHIFGPEEDPGYWQECRRLIDELPAPVECVYHGAVEYARVPEILAEQDLLFLPSTGENYGHAIVEALVAGTPVLISDQTPWRGLREDGLGWDLSLSRTDLFVRALHEYAAVDRETRASGRAAVRENAMIRLAAGNVVDAHRALFGRAQSRRSMESRAE